MEVIFVTGNKHKVHEAKTMLKPLGLDVIQKDLGYPEIQADTIEEVAKAGIDWCMERLKKPCFIEDAGLLIDALRNFPGPYSKYVFQTIGNEGIIRLMDGQSNRRAMFRSVVAYNDGSRTYTFPGESVGTISLASKGDGGFGYDPIFIPEGYNKTFAQMQTEEKNSLSHRGKSLNTFVNHFKKQQ